MPKKRKKKDKKSEIKVVFEEDIDFFDGFLELAEPKEVISLMYKEAFRRAKKRRTDYIT